MSHILMKVVYTSFFFRTRDIGQGTGACYNFFDSDVGIIHHFFYV